MSQNSDNAPIDKEIDLSVLSKKIGEFFEAMSVAIFKGIIFIKRNFIVILTLIILGFAIGYYLDRGSKIYDNQIIVAPNFGSTEYLYSKIDLLNSKIKESDTVFLKAAGIQNTSRLLSVKIEPIVDIYGFVNNSSVTDGNSQNFELIKLLSESSDVNKVINEKLTSKNYPNHTITVVTKGFADNVKLIEPILSFLNTSGYYQNLQKSHRNNIYIKMREDSVMINQSNDILSKIASAADKNNQKSDKLTFIYNNENTQFNEILTTKNNLISELGNLRIELLNTEKIVKDFTRVLNIKNSTGINSKLKFILPLFFVISFLLLNMIFRFYNRQSAKMKNKY